MISFLMYDLLMSDLVQRSAAVVSLFSKKKFITFIF